MDDVDEHGIIIVAIIEARRANVKGSKGTMSHKSTACRKKTRMDKLKLGNRLRTRVKSRVPLLDKFGFQDKMRP